MDSSSTPGSRPADASACGLPAAGGTYVLGIVLERDVTITPGALGSVSLGAGLWLYVGSALGPGGLRARVGRHLERSCAQPGPRPGTGPGPGPGTRHWHVDHLLAEGRIAAVIYAVSPKRLEHRWAGLLSGLEGVSPGPAGFGSSDCGCVTHLYRATRVPDPEVFRVREDVHAQILEWEEVGSPPDP